MNNLVQNSFRTRLLVLWLLLWVLADVARPCNVPAFRYALERWPADLYQVVVYYQATRPGTELEVLRKGAADRGGPANYSLKLVDVTKPEGKAAADQRKITAYPWIEVSYPVHSEVQGVVWSGPMTSGRAAKILQSPSRARLAQRLLSGEVAVWVFVRSGHEAKDRPALELLTASLRRASATLRIPETGTDLNGDPVAVTDFKTYPVHFALVEIAKDDPDEELLATTLLKSEPDLRNYDEPMAFPVFGRGRALYALVGKGIQEDTVLEACQSLLNWCSCEIKAANPGTDLLISADWSRPFGGKMVEDPDVPLVGLSGFIPDKKSAASAGPASKPEAVKPPSPTVCEVPAAAARVAQSARVPAKDQRLSRNLFYLAGGAGLVLAALSVIVSVRKRR